MNGLHERRYGNPSKSAFTPETIKSSDRDTAGLAAQGKRQQLSVSVAHRLCGSPDINVEEIWLHRCHCIFLDSAHILGGDCCVIHRNVPGVWEYTLTMLRTIGAGFLNGGPVALIYGFFLSWTGAFAICLSLAEMASMAPVASAQYHFVAMLTPPGASKLLSWVSGKTCHPTLRDIFGF